VDVIVNKWVAFTLKLCTCTWGNCDYFCLDIVIVYLLELNEFCNVPRQFFNTDVRYLHIIYNYVCFQKNIYNYVYLCISGTISKISKIFSGQISKILLCQFKYILVDQFIGEGSLIIWSSTSSQGTWTNFSFILNDQKLQSH
jgi:hypothetical protein